MKLKLIIAVFLLTGFSLGFAGNVEADRLLSEGLRYFQDSQFNPAIEKFQLIVGSPYLNEYHGIAHFMLGKSYLAVGNYKEAAAHLEFFLLNYKDHAYYSEAYYLKAKVLFHQGDISNSILMSEDFIARYPGSPFVPNAYFLIGECLYNLGQLDRAFKMYQFIIEKFPTSVKIEAAQYRASLIGFKRRESELLKLLKWSYEDSLSAIEEYKRREGTYEQAIAAYQKKLPEGGGDGKDVKNLEIKNAEQELEIQSLQKENADLKQEIAVLKDKTASRKDTVTEASGDRDLTLQKKQEMLEMKERALAVKEEYLKWLQNYLENK